MKITDIIIKIYAGDSIEFAYETAAQLAINHTAKVHFTFNGAEFIVDTKTTKAFILDAYSMQMNCKAKEK